MLHNVDSNLGNMLVHTLISLNYSPSSLTSQPPYTKILDYLITSISHQMWHASHNVCKQDTPKLDREILHAQITCPAIVSRASVRE